MNTVTVDLGRRSYDILIEEQLLDKAGACIAGLRPQGATAIVTNATVAPLYAARLAAALTHAGFTTAVIELPDGEQYKTHDQLQRLYSGMLAAGLDRQSLLIALGGGVIGDMAGFAAATYMRGVTFIQIPTTLLAQVDSSIGGKTGVNLPEGKNLVGAFYQPLMVLIDPQVLKTLPARQLQSGAAEVVKSAIIHDAKFFDYLEQNTSGIAAASMPVLKNVIATCCSIKALITSRDETEQGIRAFLNFGHTIGHAIETLTEYASYTHGEAVAIGMAASAHLSCRLGLCKKSDAERLISLLRNIGLPTALPCFSAPAYVDAVLKDKKKTADALNMVFMKEIGTVCIRTTAAQELSELLVNEFSL
ncbi:MAG: 3-dehydroquinate synthase [Deltaproteobacteria bacterium]|nr:3-dehydroquinate synthase [Deltaproteobacteria bacterium]